MARGSREQSSRMARAARMSAQFDRALAEAAEAMDLLGGGWEDADAAPRDDDGDGLPLEFQLADLERAVDTMLQERDRFLSGPMRGARDNLSDGEGQDHPSERWPPARGAPIEESR